MEDRFISASQESHSVEIPLLLAVGVEARTDEPGKAILAAGGKSFAITWQSEAEWDLALEPARVSPSYGVELPTKRLIWRSTGPLRTFKLTLAPGA